MKKIILILAVLLSTPVMASDNYSGSYTGQPWIPFGAGVILGALLTSRPAYTYEQVPPPQAVGWTNKVEVYPTNAGFIQMPWQQCELRSQTINGQVVTGNYCYTK